MMEELISAPAEAPTESEYFRFNLNDHIRVKIKPKGFILWKQNDDEFLPEKFQHPLSHYTSKADADGYVDFQVWSFMETFGPHINMGSSPPFETNVLIKKVQLHEPERA